jgi:hypothetical protein
VPLHRAQSRGRTWGGLVIDHQPQRRLVGADRLSEEFAQHVRRQLARRAVQGLRCLLGFASGCRGDYGKEPEVASEGDDLLRKV